MSTPEAKAAVADLINGGRKFSAPTLADAFDRFAEPLLERIDVTDVALDMANARADKAEGALAIQTQRANTAERMLDVERERTAEWRAKAEAARKEAAATATELERVKIKADAERLKPAPQPISPSWPAPFKAGPLPEPKRSQLSNTKPWGNAWHD